ncbi:MAG: phage tail sheath family protein [Candidatus Binatia bacterium]
MAEVGTYSGSEAHGRAPGVYIEDIKPAPAAALATGVPLFIGFAASGAQPLQSDRNETARPVRLASWEQFEQSFGDAAPGSFLGYAVRGFFENGGERCVVVPLMVNEAHRSPAALAGALENLFRKDENGLRGILDDIDETDLVCVPDVMMEEIRRSEETLFEIQHQVLKYCKDMGERFAILDVLPGDTVEIEKIIDKAIRHWQELVPTEGAIYFPWVCVKSLDGSGEQWVPPCGHIAGIYARTDAQVGFHKAPANEIVEGVLDLRPEITPEIQSRLNDVGVNCIRSLARRGIRVWGARTLSGLSNWRYVNVRRIFLTLVRWIEHNTNDLVFEPNGPPLWERVRERLGAYCYGLFQRGALKGLDPAEAFFVKCDAETNPLDVREAGQLICEVGLAPLTPAEFIVIRITQNPAGASVTVVTG